RAVCNSAFRILIRSAVHQSQHHSANSFSGRALGISLPVIRHPHVRPGAKPDQTFCRTPHGRTGIEVPHTSGSWEFAALLSSCHRDVLVRLWTDEPLYRTLVFHSRRGSPAGHGVDGANARE